MNPAPKMRPKLTASLETVRLNRSTVLTTPFSSLCMFWLARSSSIEAVVTVIVSTRAAMMAPASAKLKALILVPTFQLAG